MSRYLPDIAGLFCLITWLVFTLLISDVFLTDGDPFWHIKAGSVMLADRALLTHDIFSHTAFGAPWTAHEWLAEIIMAGLHRLAGLEGVIVFFILLVSITFWLLFKTCEKLSGEKTALGCVFLALFFAGTHLTARPHLFTWFFLVFALTFNRVKLTWSERLLLLFFLNAALVHTRNISLFLIVLAPAFARGIKTYFDQREWIFLKPSSSRPALKLSPMTGPVMTVSLTLLLLLAGFTNRQSLAFLTPQKVFKVEVEELEKLTSYLKTIQPAGRLFNEYIIGGYLLYALNPPPQVFIDGRADMYGEKNFLPLW